MKQLFDSKLFEGLGKVADCLIVSFFWLMCCLPIVTIGAATTAMYYTVHKSIIGDREYVTRCFFSSFKDNFKQATICNLVLLAVLLILGVDAYIVYQMAVAGESSAFIFYFFLVAILYVIGWGCVLFPYMARFQNTTKNTLKSAVFLEMRHLPTSIALIASLILTVFLILYVPLCVLFMPAVLFLLYDFLLERVFRKYMNEEDLARELEYKRQRNEDRRR